MKTELNTYNHVLFTGVTIRIRYLLWLFISNFFFLTNIPYPVFFKVFLLKLFGAKIGFKAVIKPWVTIKFPWNLEMGDHVWLGESVWIDNISFVKIASHTCISQGSIILTGNHDYGKRTFDLISRPITLEDGVWIGAKCMITGGVTIQSHAVISAGCIVNKSVEPYFIYGGNPLEKIKKRIIT